MTDLSVTATTAAAAATTKSKSLGSLDKDAFLKLLVAQLKYQNPLSPADPSQMMAQTAQFTMVESLQQISKSQTDAGAWQQVLAGQGLIGKQVTGKIDDASVTGVVTGLTITADGPLLQLAGGQTLAVSAVATVTPPPAATTPAATTPAATAAATTPAATAAATTAAADGTGAGTAQTP